MWIILLNSHNGPIIIPILLTRKHLEIKQLDQLIQLHLNLSSFRPHASMFFLRLLLRHQNTTSAMGYLFPLVGLHAKVAFSMQVPMEKVTFNLFSKSLLSAYSALPGTVGCSAGHCRVPTWGFLQPPTLSFLATPVITLGRFSDVLELPTLCHLSHCFQDVKLYNSFGSLNQFYKKFLFQGKSIYL